MSASSSSVHVQRYDVIVAGLGGMGSAAAYHLARRGYRVLGLDARQPGHTEGSSHGRSRIIREAYFEAPDYVPLIRRAYALWQDLEAETGQHLLTITGGLNLGQRDSHLVQGALASAHQHHVVHEYLTARDVMARFQAFRLSEEFVAVYEPTAGVLDPEACIRAHLDMASRHDADLHHGEPVQKWEPDGDGVRVDTDQHTYRADRLVIAAGPWASEFLTDLHLPLTVWRIVNVHFEPDQVERFVANRCPVHIWELPEGEFYGVPALPGHGVKFGRHDTGEHSTPSTVRREVDTAEIDELRNVLNRYLPGSASAVKWTLTCLYTVTPDHHFVIDQHPEHPQVVFGCGFSGHGFKFASSVGEALADLATEGVALSPIGFLSATRFTS